jgi:hypothetical protein
MSMLDYVECKYLLPDAPPEVQTAQFQTHSFDDRMDRYVIEEDGRLRLYRRTDFSPGGISVEREQELISYTGSLTFWTHFGQSNPFDPATQHSNEWYEYTALFRDGSLFAIVREMEGHH